MNPPRIPIPLHLVDGKSFFGYDCQCLIFDNSCLEDWQVCKRLYQYKQADSLTSSTESAGRNFGSACHRAWEARYRLVGPGPVTSEVEVAMNSALAKHFEENPQPIGDFRNLDHAQRYIQVYNEIYPKEPFSIFVTPKGQPFVEQTFALPFGEKVTVGNNTYEFIYAGKSDLGILNPDFWTFDHKTAFQFGEGFKVEKEQDGGQIGYVWAAAQTTGRLPRGYIINACRVRKPSKSDRYAGVAPIDGTDFMRLPFDVCQENIDDWRQDTLALVEEIVWCHQRGYFPRHRKHCNGKYGVCEFYKVCSVIPSSRHEPLNSNLYKINDWTPLRRPEE